VDFSFLYKGFLDASFGTMVLYTLVMTHITIVSVTVYLHRYSAHRALELNGGEHFFRWLWLTTDVEEGMDVGDRKHHVNWRSRKIRTARRFSV
jgi:fatty-acid desaturase